MFYSYKNISDIYLPVSSVEIFFFKFASKDNTFDGPKSMGRDPYGPTSMIFMSMTPIDSVHF